jgi:hypothetical protein
MKLADRVDAVRTLDDFATLIEGDAWRKHLAALTEKEDASDEIETLRSAISAAKKRLSPEHSCPELQALKERVYAGAEPDALRPLLCRIAELRSALPLRRHEQLFGKAENAIGTLFTPGPASTGYSNRARRARDLFTEHAGQTKIEGAKGDRHGNADGTAYDLGRDGAFAGHVVHVLHLYTGERFDFKKPTAAFERKGFWVERRTAPGDVADFRGWLADANQLWLISTSSPVLKPGHIEAILEFWRCGGALYIWGDNQPYYADANVLLAKIGRGLKLDGCLPGAKVVKEITPDGRGFHAHLVTTGLQRLYEGITVSSLDEKAVKLHGFEPLLYGSAGNLITAVRGPTPEAGAVMIDGGFTRLYHQWDDAGSARYVCNAACFLAAMTVPEDEKAEEKSPESEHPEALPFDPAGAFRGKCELTEDTPETWLVMSVEEMADPLRNTSDLVLNDPLGAGAANCIFSSRLYGEGMGQWVIDQGADPFTRRPVAAVLPLVDLSSEKNRKAFTHLLCHILMGGKSLPTAARLLFFAIVDQMRDKARKSPNPQAWDYLHRQCLANFRSTAEFGEMGRKMPLLDAMAAYFSPATDAMTQVRRSFATVALIGRTLLAEGRGTRQQVRLIARRSLMKALVADAVAAEKAALAPCSRACWRRCTRTSTASRASTAGGSCPAGRRSPVTCPPSASGWSAFWRGRSCPSASRRSCCTRCWCWTCGSTRLRPQWRNC